MTLTLPIERSAPSRNMPSEPSRRYSRSIYLWTLSQWDVNRADIERRTATAALNAILNGQRMSTPPTPKSSGSAGSSGFFD